MAQVIHVNFKARCYGTRDGDTAASRVAHVAPAANDSSAGPVSPRGGHPEAADLRARSPRVPGAGGRADDVALERDRGASGLPSLDERLRAARHGLEHCKTESAKSIAAAEVAQDCSSSLAAAAERLQRAVQSLSDADFGTRLREIADRHGARS